MKMRGWFGPKYFGWGVAPRSWQGWLALLIYVGAIYFISQLREIARPDKLTFSGLATVVMVAVMILTYAKDRPRDER